jgi:predicted O-methyltransferase YrrM
MCDPTWQERIGRAARRLRALEPGEPPPRDELDCLRLAWGNEPFAADADLLEAVATLASRAEGPILECGCGLTSLVLAAVAGRRGISTWSLEYAEEWIERVARALRAADLAGIELRHAPMRAYCDFAWFDPPLEELPAQLSLVVCDGPNGLHPLARPHKDPLARYGLMPVLGERLAPGGIILLDDVHRDGEREVLRRWLAEGDGSLDHEIRRSTKGAFALIRKAARPAQGDHPAAAGAPSMLDRDGAVGRAARGPARPDSS